MWVVAASYLVTFGFVLYLLAFGPSDLKGLTLSFGRGAPTVRSVVADSPESRAGLQPGDRILAIDDRPLRGLYDWVAATGNLQVGRPQRWVVDRGGESVHLDIDPDAATIRSRVNAGYIQYLSLAITGLALGLLIAWKRPGDAVGRLGAWFMMTASIAFGFPFGWAATWRALPGVIQSFLWIPQLSRFVLEGILLSFFLVFPNRLVKRTWQWLLVWVPVLLTLPWRVKGFEGVIHPGTVEPVPGWILQAANTRILVYLVGAMVVLIVSYHRFSTLNEKRRVRVLMFGAAVSTASAMATVAMDNFVGRSRLYDTGLYVVFAAVIIPLNTALPLSMAYAILRHRALDISVIVRQGLRYVLARGAVIGLVPALGAILLVDLVMNSQQPLADIFRTRGWFYVAAAGLSLLAYWKRHAWLEAIDRRFFRERYDAQQVLREVLAEIRTARNFHLVAPRVVERLASAFHAEFVAAMVRSPDDSHYRSLASSPAGRAPEALEAEAKLIGLLRVLGKPLDVLHGDSGWLGQRLPPVEASFLHQAQIDLLVPIAMTPDQAEAMLALGPKRSEEPYTHEDQEFLEAIAASLALLVETPAQGPVVAPEMVSGAFRECPDCGACYEPALAACDRDGAALRQIDVSRILAGRYRLERRRGHGGMGTVYEAEDAELQRHVAVKLIREDWADRAEAITRFRREARVAAGFAHPNVVTVHDYGVERDKRAFLVMELLEGRTLRDELDQHGRLAPTRVAEILRGACAGVEAAHQHELIHRDIKPANIFLAKTGQEEEVVKVLDFGLAKFLPAYDDSTPTRTKIETEEGVLVGTPAYMSPEQLLGMQLDRSWDVWALAVVTYQALTGALPFGGEGSDWRRALMAGEFTPVGRHLPEARDDWDPFFARCFSTEPGRRPASAADFWSELARTLT